ncbi:MAG TPA: AraC family transcriptional regulator [Solirubrobacteraceae bacterium]|nr:AraC family transcriptional regulator [Solirubrobacteraceae bacterium]
MRADTHSERQRLYLLARVLVKRHYRRRLTLAHVAGALHCSPRQLQRAFAERGNSFHEELTARRLAAAAELLAEQPLAVDAVARLVGYSGGSYLARAFQRRYGLPPARFRERARGSGSARGG